MIHDPLHNRETALIVLILVKNVLLKKRRILLMDIVRELAPMVSYKQIHYRIDLLETFGYVSTTRYKLRKNINGRLHPQIMVHIHTYGRKRLYAYLQHLLL